MSKGIPTITYVLVAGGILGLILGLSGIQMEAYDWIILWGAIFIVLVLFMMAILVNPTRLLMKGEYQKAIEHLTKLTTRYEKDKKIKNALLYNIAMCYNRMGNLIKSIEVLYEIDIEVVDKNIKWGYHTLLAINYMLLEEEIDKIESNLQLAKENAQIKELLPIIAYYEVLKGNDNESLKYIEEYLNTRKKRKFVFSFTKSTLVIDKFSYEIENNFFIGLSYLKMNKHQQAKEYLIRATKSHYSNYFSKRAEELLEGLQ